MTVGSISNFNYINASGRVDSPAEGYLSRNKMPAFSPVLRALSPITQGSNALFYSPDGDLAELSNAAILLSMPTSNQNPAAPGMPNSQTPVIDESGLLEALEPQGTCYTCENRKYVDQSDDASVSFQTPTKVSPNMAAAAVASHEQEHVRNEQAKAHREDRQIISQSVSLTYDTCPECGRHYVSGGTTRTTSVGKSDSEDSFEPTLIEPGTADGEPSDDND